MPLRLCRTDGPVFYPANPSEFGSDGGKEPESPGALQDPQLGVLSIALERCTEKAVPTASSWATSTLGVAFVSPRSGSPGEGQSGAVPGLATPGSALSYTPLVSATDHRASGVG